MSIHPQIEKLYEQGDIILEQWFDSLALSDLPNGTKKLLKKFVFFKKFDKSTSDISPQIPTNAALSKDIPYKKFFLSEVTQMHLNKYINKIKTKLYECNPDILGEKQIPLNTELILKKKSNKIIEVAYYKNPSVLRINANEFYTTIKNEDALAFLLAHELMHLTIREKYKWITPGKTEESLCDILAVICAARAGYRPAEAALWMINQNPRDWNLIEFVNQNTIPENPSPHERLFFSEAQYIGLIKLPDKKQDQLEPENEFLFKIGIHPNALIRGIYLTKINNFLIEKNYINSERTNRTKTPIDPTFMQILNCKKQRKTPVYPKKLAYNTKIKIKKQRQNS